ncbi:MAG: glycosyl hydrolase [Bacteroidota bacterium]
MRYHHQWKSAVCALALIGCLVSLQAQKKRKAQIDLSPSEVSFDDSLYNALEWRLVGPFRGGRSAAVTGVPGKPTLFYMGATGGGVWRTQDGGSTWENISDGYFGGSVGAVAVSQSDNNVLYVGGGEVTVRGNVSYGYGMYKSVDAGKTWKHIGLENSRHIPKIQIHPDDPNLVYAAVMGDLYQSSEERGVYRSKDGGKNWEKILFANADAGAVDLCIDPSNPRVLFASTWRIRRTPYDLSSGGEGSDLWKSVDGGDTWAKISGNQGLPKGPLGIIGVSVSPVNPNRVFTIIEAKEGGVFRSDDGGATWQKTNQSRALRQRAWYYSRIFADTQDENIVYVVNVAYHKSTDGGKTFKASNAPHGDHHDMWIAPEDNQRMIMADDGGAQVSYDAGENWSTYYNQPTAQFYRVVTDDDFPYRIYVAQQDNSTLRIRHRTDGGNIGERDWEPSAGGESAHLAPDPNDNDIVYGGSYGGFLTRVNHRTKETRAVNVWPDNPMGYGAEGMKFRFQWNFPIFFSPHDKNKLYTASNHMHVSTNGGQSWKLISPDLTRNDSAKLVSSGGPITQDNTGVEYYCTIFAACESPYEENLLWAASDDGLLHVSKDGGDNWENVTSSQVPEWMMFNSVEPDPFNKGAIYVAGTRYKLGDYQPYLYHVTDYGKSWRKMIAGIDPTHFTRVVRADPDRKGLLYAGTETGMYISFDDGYSWKPFQLNLPIVPITDLAIKNDNLIAATQGRSIWMIDDLTPLHQLTEEVASSSYHLFQPMASYRVGGGGRFRGGASKTEGENHPGGVLTYFYLADTPEDEQEISLEFLELNGKLIKRFSTKAEDKRDKLSVKTGMNVFNWNMRYADAKSFDGLIMWAGRTTGPQAVPGTYKVRLTVGSDSMEQSFEILKDPRSSSSLAELQQQFDFLIQVRDKLSETHQTITDIREARTQLKMLTDKIKTDSTYKEIVKACEAFDKEMTEIEKTLYQTKNQSRQDPLNFPIKLNNKLAHVGSLSGYGNFPPTAQAQAFFEEVKGKIDAELSNWDKLKTTKLPEINEMVREKQVDAIILKEPTPTGD